MPTWVETVLDRQFIAELTLLGMGFDAVGGCYLAYDLLGGKRGPLRTFARATSYVALYFIGYSILLGLRYGIVAAAGMGILIAIEFRLAGSGSPRNEKRRSPFAVYLFGFLRGVVLGLAGMTIAGLMFGTFFGLLSGAGLIAVYSLGFAPTDDYGSQGKPHLSRHLIVASFLRALAVSAAGVIASLLASPATHWVLFGLKLGLTAGTVSALVGLFSPVIEWRIENLPERRLGVLGLGLIFVGLLMQSVQYWIVVFSVPVP
jgi:hypothetical protein